MTEYASAFGPVVGHASAKETLQTALASGRLHHGWLFQGPRGVGKLRLALQFASALLRGPAYDLEAAADDPVARLIETGAHPDFRWIRRPVDDKGKLKAEIPVDSARTLSEFFALRPAMGGWRVAIIDAVDELNRFGANALLKTLEEPPANALLILIAHGERPVLPTLKSRCRLLRLAPLADEETISVLVNTGLAPDTAADAAKLAQGRPGRALALQSSEARAATRAIIDAAAAQGRLDARGLNTAISTAAKSDIAFDAAFTALANWVQTNAVSADTPSRAGAWAEAHARTVDLASETKGLNMDKAQAVSQALLMLQKTAKAG